ncbi:hypothetical protein [Mesobacterium pallidum]|uniref:hypothetical protein n=1 Tax=Mesobacterium pallidum TaxID=2872037 RepID=UPI001EE17ABA|nr:hypothetical protein [Mesobacterium pallidum]
MTEFTVTNTRLREALWEGLVTRTGKGTLPPELTVTHLGRQIDDVALKTGESDGEWVLHVPIPPEVIADGVQTILIADARSDETLFRIALIVGEPLDEDLRAEIDLLRAELDMLKRAFRKHCVETA